FFFSLPLPHRHGSGLHHWNTAASSRASMISGPLIPFAARNSTACHKASFGPLAGVENCCQAFCSASWDTGSFFSAHPDLGGAPAGPRTNWNVSFEGLQPGCAHTPKNYLTISNMSIMFAATL